MRSDQYIAKLTEQVLAKENLAEVISDCDEMFKEYKERSQKIGSVEEFMQDMGILERINTEYDSVENFIMNHF